MFCKEKSAKKLTVFCAAIYNNFEYKCEEQDNCEASNHLRNDFPSYFNIDSSGAPTHLFRPGAGVGIDQGLGDSVEIHSLSKPWIPLVFISSIMS